MLILVVDDDAPVCDLVATVLEDAGYQVMTAFDGRTALEVLDDLPSPPALIVLDLMLPQLTGIEVYTTLQQNPPWNSIPVIVWTAVVPGEDTLAALRGARILQKPASVDVLLSAVAQIGGTPV
jgi:CheY-like chemotaxis protein